VISAISYPVVRHVFERAQRGQPCEYTPNSWGGHAAGVVDCHLGRHSKRSLRFACLEARAQFG
jgi:hypothetical protein